MVFSYILNARKKFAIYIGDQVGAPEEQIVIISTMAAVIPFSILNYCIKGKTNRLLYSLIIGFMFHISIYGYKSLHVIFSTLAVYYYCYFLEEKNLLFMFY